MSLEVDSAGGATLAGPLTTTGSGPTTLAFPSSAATYTFPAATDTMAGLATIETWTAAQSFNDGKMILNGSTSGTLVIHAAAIAGSSVLTFPAGTTDFSSTGGTSKVVMQVTAGAALTVAQLAASNLSNGVSGTGAVILAGGTPTFTGAVGVAGSTTALVTSSAAFSSGASNKLGTLTNAPATGDPTTWIKIIDNGTTRYIPAW